MTSWQVVQWVATVGGFIFGAGGLGWVVSQGRKLSRAERQRREAEESLLVLIDSLKSHGVTGASWKSIEPGLRKAAMLGREWGALNVRWNCGTIEAQLGNWSDWYDQS